MYMATDGNQLASLPTTLPDDLSMCHAMIGQLLEALGDANRKLTHMEHKLQQLLRRLYGRSSEKLDPKQMALFAEMLEQMRGQEAEAGPEPQTVLPKSPAGKGHGRRKLPPDLPRDRVVHDLPDKEKPCPCCGEMRIVIGEETSEQLDYIPAKVKVIEHARLKYVCKSCERKAAEGGPQIEVAAKPLSPIEKGLAAPGLLSHVIVSKFDDHLPLYRLERIFGRLGIDLSRSTMCGWMRQSAEALRPLYDWMAADVLGSKVIHTDDTPVPVQDKGRGKTKTGRFWVYSGDEAHPQVVFDYTPSRKRDGPMAFLKDWGAEEERYLQADAFGGYDGIYAGEAGGKVVEVACWAHARRKFYDARKSDARHRAEALAHIRLLYDVERKARERYSAQLASAAADESQPLRLLSEIRLKLRQEFSVGRLAELKAWMERVRATAGGSVLPKSPVGEAITYALNQWDALAVYTTDGDLAIDNNAAENALRRIALGRKNWLFAGSDNGGRTAAILFSLLATCQRHEVEPLSYLRDVLTRIAAHPASGLADFAPHRWQPLA